RYGSLLSSEFCKSNLLRSDSHAAVPVSQLIREGLHPVLSDHGLVERSGLVLHERGRLPVPTDQRLLDTLRGASARVPVRLVPRQEGVDYGAAKVQRLRLTGTRVAEDDEPQVRTECSCLGDHALEARRKRQSAPS